MGLYCSDELSLFGNEKNYLRVKYSSSLCEFNAFSFIRSAAIDGILSNPRYPSGLFQIIVDLVTGNAKVDRLLLLERPARNARSVRLVS